MLTLSGTALCFVLAGMLLAGYTIARRAELKFLNTILSGTRLVLLDAWTGDVKHGQPAPDATISSSIPRCERVGWHPAGECNLLHEVRVYNFSQPAKAGITTHLKGHTTHGHDVADR